MRKRLHAKLVAALVAPALVVSGAAQGMLLMRCGPEARMSCCCAKADAHAPSVTNPLIRQCCDTISIPSSPAQPANEGAISTVAAPMVSAIVGPVVRLAPVLTRARHLVRVRPLPGVSAVLANLALLI